MDEADKYQQRLEVIAEKRRLQEEQDKVRREMEEEKLRLQQLKRKSLRDQWLMDSAPSSPTSPDAPPCGSQAQEIEKHSDKLESQSQQLDVEGEKLKEQMEDGQMVMKVGQASSEMIENDLKMSQSPQVEETVALLTNGGGSLEADPSPTALRFKSQSKANGPVVASESINSEDVEPGFCVSDAEPNPVSNVGIKEDEEDGTLIIRAERVIVTDDDDVPEDPKPQQDQGNGMISEETPLPRSDVGHEGGDSEERVKAAKHLDTFVQPEFGETTKSTETEAAFADGVMQDGVKELKGRHGEAKYVGHDEQSEHSSSVQVQSLSQATEGATMSPVPVYSRIDSKPELGAQSAGAVSSEGAEAALKCQDARIPHDQFQEVPLADSLEKQKTEGGPEEQEPLLSEGNSQAEPAAAAANAPTSSETHNEIPKHKSCQCCSVM
ncbi:paralemmin-3 [Brachionichthys hirsutus]|uniref:paralemmin-3 n=1 Tax=Brachionichthys hirsutus TaxID=412623 RepID=UPI0036044B89